MKTPGSSLGFSLISALLLFVVVTGCSRSLNKTDHALDANRYFEIGDYDKAEVEYFNVLQSDPNSGEATARLGIIYFEQGRLSRAVPLLLKARDLQPTNKDARIKLALAYLSTGKRKEAHEEALFVLDQAPYHSEAPLLLAKSAATPAEIEATRARFQALPTDVRERAPLLLALGTLDCAEGLFKEAEEEFKRAEMLEPKFSAVKSSLGTLYWSQKNMPQAEQAFVSAAELATDRSPAKIQLAQFRLQKGDREGARQTLLQLTQKVPDCITPWILLAQLAVSDNNLAQAEAWLTKATAREPNAPEALLVRAQITLARGDAPAAIAELEKITTRYPRAAQAYYQLGQANLVIGEVGRAITHLNQAVALSPNFTDAVVLLAGVNITKGDLSSSIILLKPLIRQHPDIAQPRLLLAEAYRRQNDLDGALSIYRELEKSFPGNPQTSWLTGLVLAQKGQKEDARQAFDHALQLQSDYLPAVEQLVNLDLSENELQAARTRVEKQIAQNSKAAAPYVLLAQIASVEKRISDAESALQKAIALEPTAPSAYFMLARLYISSQQQQKALANLKEVIAQKPQETTALMLMGVIYDQDKNYSAAVDTYEKLLVINPQFSAALNNLAYLYSEHVGQLDKAFQMAKRARELLPTEPNTADTLGWILYKRHQYSWALSLLSESARALPSNPEIQYHLGMTQYWLGQEDASRTNLQRALDLGSGFPGFEEAKQSLTILAVDVSTAGEADKAVVNRQLKQHPLDPIALARLGGLYERENNPGKALEIYQTALKESPGDVSLMLKIADLHRRQKEPQKAIELLKLARKQAPDDFQIAHRLGTLLYGSLNYRWSFSLLQECAAKQPDDPEILFDLGHAAYGLGRIEEAETALQSALETKSPFANRESAKQYLDLITLAKNPPTGAEVAVQNVLSANPGDLPALMAAAAIAEKKGDVRAAKSVYENILSRSPEFNPARKQLAMLCMKPPSDLPKAYNLAMRAREDLAQDMELARVLGIIAYRLGEFEKAASLLGESAGSRCQDADLMYHWGIAQYRIKDYNGSRRSLAAALELNPNGELALDAKNILAELK